MDPNCNTVAPPRQKIPKDGLGPRGFPDCYYTSRVLKSTANYARFVKKLRQKEEEDRVGQEGQLNYDRNRQYNDFFTRCNRRSLINKVEHRVNLCLESYQDDLANKRMRLNELLLAEEEVNIRIFMKQAQAGAELVWQDKKDRLAFLLAKRKKEHEEKYKDPPLSKCPHLYRCLLKKQNKETAECHLYQIREKQMRKLAEAENDKMWHELAMKESEALAARMDLDTMERRRREAECMIDAEHQMESRRKQREKEKQILKQEALQLKAEIEAYKRQEEEDERKSKQQSYELAKAKLAAVEERKQNTQKRAEEDIITNVWQRGIEQNIALDNVKEEQRKQKMRDLDVCNFRMKEMKDRIAEVKVNNESMILKEGQEIRDAADLKRCQYQKWLKKDKLDIRNYNLNMFAEKLKERADVEGKLVQEEYERQLKEQTDQLVKQKQMTTAQVQKLYQKDLQGQMAYTQLLKDRARQEELDQRRKSQLATQEYQEAISKMLCRPFFSDRIHPFMQQMTAEVRMKPKCPCTSNYCANPPQASSSHRQ